MYSKVRFMFFPLGNIQHNLLFYYFQKKNNNVKW
uniref:Uncharacterized protein n=1 Tax=Anguilla anguilla TaxID=7936 RepID=A0A0E9TEF0_ANGAN